MFQKIKDFLFKNSTAKQTVAKNTVWLSISNFGGRIIKAAIIIYAARVLGTDGYGLFSYAVTLAGFITLFVDPGINSILIRDAAKGTDDDKQAIFSTTLVMKTALIGAAIFVVIFIAPYFSTLPGAKALLPIVALILSFDSFREFFSSLIRAKEKMEWEAGIFILMNTSVTIFGFLFLFKSATALSFGWAYAIGTGIGALAALVVVRSYLKKTFSSFSFKLAKSIIKSAWPFAVIGALGLLLTNTDILIISWMRSASEVGIYSAVIRVVQVLYLIPGIFQLTTLPIFSRLAKQDNARFRTVFERTLGMIFLTSIPIALAGAVLATQIVVFVFGGAYHAGGPSFMILMIGLLFDYPTSIIAAAIFCYDHQKSLIISSAIAGIVNVGLDIILIPRIGITGSAIATLIAQFVSNWYLWHMMKKLNYFAVLPQLKKVIAAGMIMVAATVLMYFGGFNVIINSIISAGIYFLALIVLKESLLREIVQMVIPGKKPVTA